MFLLVFKLYAPFRELYYHQRHLWFVYFSRRVILETSIDRMRASNTSSSKHVILVKIAFCEVAINPQHYDKSNEIGKVETYPIIFNVVENWHHFLCGRIFQISASFLTMNYNRNSETGTSS